MEIKRIVVIIVALIGSLILVSQSRAQERLKKIRITYPTESIAVLPLFAAYRWKTFENNDLQAEIIQARSQVANAALASGEIGLFCWSRPGVSKRDSEGPSIARGLVCQRRDYLLAARPARIF
jgi:hypothetical protein